MRKPIGLLALLCILVMLMSVALLAESASAEDLVIPGSGNPEHVLGELARAFNAGQTRHRVLVPPTTGTAGAVRDVSEGTAVLGRVGRPLDAAELARGLTYLPLARDAIAVAGGATVNARGISGAQLVAVFAGKITDWSVLGGKAAPIRVIGKEKTDTIRQQVEKKFGDLVMGDAVRIVHLDSQVLELIDRYPTSFATLNRSALGATRNRVAILTLDGVEPSLENLESGRYPLSVDFGLIHKSGGVSLAAKAFLEFIGTGQAVKIMRAQGVLPLNAPH